MASITQDMRFRLSLINYAEKYGVTRAAIKYKTNRQYVYRWKRRYNGSIEFLRGLSRRPHHHPILTSIHLPKSGLSRICAEEIPMPGLLFSGLSSCSAAVHAPSRDCTASSKNKVSWLYIPLTPGISQNPMSRWTTPARVSRLT